MNNTEYIGAKKQEGFPGQLSYVIPDRILSLVSKNPICSDLFITDIGYYPKASHHFRERKDGVKQTILIYNVHGKGTIEVGKNRFQIMPDHFFIIPEDIPHSYFADPKNPWTIYWIHFSGNKSKMIATPVLKPVEVERTKTSRVTERLNLFHEIFQNMERGFSMETTEYVNLCLPHLLASFTHLQQYRAINEQVSKDPVAESINFMLDNINQKFRLSELANAAQLSTSHYSRIFLSRTGHSPIDYFIQLKIQRSCRFLDNTKLSIAEISREVGFEDQFYFSRQFRKIMNMSPRDYRNR
ncbi:helix-turn-helix domain-containing protein [Sunxiuqinia sp. A32]|uniref:helix-turn-helix domain-containing protein n=1 Tax=Sunxiuqinia sp. A32 TaxID=3461496 RepID=UPI004045AD0D